MVAARLRVSVLIAAISEGDAGLDHYDSGWAAASYAGVGVGGAAGDAAEVQVVDIGVRISELFRVGDVLRGGAQLHGDAFGNFDALHQVDVEAEGAWTGDDALPQGADLARGGVHQDGRAVYGDGL